MFVVSAAVLLVCVVQAAPAGAADRVPCLGFDRAIEDRNGSVVAAGSKCIARFDPSGTLDRNFGTGGSAPLDIGTHGIPTGYAFQPDGGRLLDLVRVDGGYLVVTNTALIRFRSDGTRDASFGGDGRIDDVEAVPHNAETVDAAVLPDGSIFLAGRQDSGGTGRQTVAKLKSDGAIDPSFGVDGIFRTGPFAVNFTRIAIDGASRVLLAGTSITPATVGVMRLTPGGTVDAGFGDAGTTESAPMVPPVNCGCETTFETRRISIAPGGQITLLGSSVTVYYKSSGSSTGWIKFGKDGEPGSLSAPNTTFGPAFAELPDGDIAIAQSGGGRLDVAGTGGFADRHPVTELNPSPAGFLSESISFNPFTGNLTSAGTLSIDPGEHCFADPCSRGGVAKIDAVTGEPDKSFGVGGVAMESPNDCQFGKPMAIPGRPWGRCPVAAPEMSARAGFSWGSSNRPSLRVEADLPEFTGNPNFAVQILRLRLPDRIHLKRMTGKPAIRVVLDSASEGRLVKSRKGRVVTVKFSPTRFPLDPVYSDEPPDASAHMIVTFRRGAISRIPKKLRHRKLNLPVTGTISANPADAKWWRKSSTRKTLRVRPVKGK